MGAFGLSTIVAEALLVAAVALLLIVGTVAGVEWWELRSLRVEYSDLQKKNAACEAESKQRSVALDAQTRAVETAKKEGDAAVAAAKAAGEQAARAAYDKAQARYVKAKAELARVKPVDPAQLCPAAQRENAEFLRGRQ